LNTAGCERFFKEKVTGATADRPQLKKLLREVGHGDVVIVAAVDRLSRDTTDLMVIARDLHKAGAGLRSLAEPVVDTTSDFAEIGSCHAWRFCEARTPTHQGAHGARPRRCKSQWREIRAQAETHAAPEARSD
jgi:Resolvase, N terminal domain